MRIDDWGVGLDPARGEIAWADIERIEVVTTGDGPWREDFFWLLENAQQHGLAVGGEEAEAVNFLPVLQQRYPDLDNEALIGAVRSTNDARFLIWRRRTY